VRINQAIACQVVLTCHAVVSFAEHGIRRLIRRMAVLIKPAGSTVVYVI